MTDRATAQAAIDGLAAKQGQSNSVSPLTLANDRLQALLDASVTKDDVNLNDRYTIKPIPGGAGSLPNALGLYETVSGVEVLIGSIGDTYSKQLVFYKGLGGTRFFDENTGFEYFVSRRDVSGDGLGATFGNPDGTNFISTKQTGGLEVYHQTATDISQQLGNPASTNYIESNEFIWSITSDQVKPYGILAFDFVAETDTDFADVPFDVQILDASGSYVYSDIQNSEIWDVEPQPPGSPQFKLSSSGGVVTLPAPQPFPMESSTTYTLVYKFKQNIRLKGDLFPAILMRGKRLEYYPINYTSQEFEVSANFTINSGGTYLVNCSAAGFTGTVHPTVKSATFRTRLSGERWSNTFPLTIDFRNDDNTASIGTVVFNNNEGNDEYEIVRLADRWVVYNFDGSVHEQLLIP